MCYTCGRIKAPWRAHESSQGPGIKNPSSSVHGFYSFSFIPEYNPRFNPASPHSRNYFENNGEGRTLGNREHGSTSPRLRSPEMSHSTRGMPSSSWHQLSILNSMPLIWQEEIGSVSPSVGIQQPWNHHISHS